MELCVGLVVVERKWWMISVRLGYVFVLFLSSVGWGMENA